MKIHEDTTFKKAKFRESMKLQQALTIAVTQLKRMPGAKIFTLEEAVREFDPGRVAANSRWLSEAILPGAGRRLVHPFRMNIRPWKGRSY